MKRILALCLCCLLPFASALAESADPLLDRGLALIQDMDELAGNAAYWQAMTGSEEITSVAQQISAADYGAPKAVYRVTFSEALLPSLLDEAGLSDMPEHLRSYLTARIYAALPSQLCAYDGTVTLAAATALSVGDAFICGDLQESALYVFVYDGDFSAAVTYTAGDESIVQASALFIPTHVLTDSTDLGLEDLLGADAYVLETIY